jgi:CRISPR system Cascade subunit CasD
MARNDPMIGMMLLDAPMMSFSTRTPHSVTDDRTLMSPSKSAVAGIVANAKGLDRTECEDFLEMFNRMPMHSVTYALQNDVMHKDYCLIGSGESNKRFKLTNTEGKTQHAASIKNKMYLVGTLHYIFVEGNEDQVKDFMSAVECPKRPLYIGRKCCIPSSPIFQGMFNDENSAREEMERQVEKRNSRKKTSWRKAKERKEASSPKGSLMIHDVVSSFNPEIKKEMSRFVVDTFF